MPDGPDVDWIDDDALDEGRLTGEAVSLDLHPTGFVLRAAGAAIDAAVQLLLLVALLLGVSAAVTFSGAEGAVFVALLVACIVVALVVVPATVETLSKGRSLGKLAVGARIVRLDGGAIGLRHAAIRALVGFLETYTMLGGGAALVGLLTPRTQRLGDLLAGTYSQYERVSGKVLPLFGMPPMLAEWGRVVDVARMPTRLSRRIADFLAQAGQYDPVRRARLAAELAAEAAEFVAPIPPVAPELFLAGVTVVRREREAEALRREAERLAVLQPALRGTPHSLADRGVPAP
jgi:uncharacterized RDD family membrane protein YckC